MKKTIAVFFGGQSVEHDISIVTGMQLIENIDKNKYDYLPVYIANDGQWYTGAVLADIAFMRNFDANNKELTPVFISPVPGERALISYHSGLLGMKKISFPFDVALLCMHGANGEDGSLQGVLEMADIPYTSSGLLGAAAGMDKVLMKAAFVGAGIPTVAYCLVLRDEWEADPDQAIAMVEAKLDYPLVVKPANLGSSIGIGVAEDRDALFGSIEVATHYDSRVIVETAITDMMEINCSVLGYGSDVRPSPCEQPISWKEFLTFEEKYLSDTSGKTSADANGMHSMSRILPAPIPDETRDYIQELSCKIFRLMDCKGVVRIDYMIDKSDDNRVYANEINTIPGSMAYYLWEEDGLRYPELIDQLIEFARVAHREKHKNHFAFASDVLKKVNFGGAKTGKMTSRGNKF